MQHATLESTKERIYQNAENTQTQFNWLEIGSSKDVKERQNITEEQMEEFIRTNMKEIRQRIQTFREYLYFKGMRATDGFHRIAQENRFTSDSTSFSPRVRWRTDSQTPGFFWEKTYLKPVLMQSVAPKLCARRVRVVSVYPPGRKDQYSRKGPHLVLSKHIAIDRKTFSLRSDSFKNEPQWARALILMAEKNLRVCRMASNRLTMMLSALAVMEKYLCEATKF